MQEVRSDATAAVGGEEREGLDVEGVGRGRRRGGEGLDAAADSGDEVGWRWVGGGLGVGVLDFLGDSWSGILAFGLRSRTRIPTTTFDTPNIPGLYTLLRSHFPLFLRLPFLPFPMGPFPFPTFRVRVIVPERRTGEGGSRRVGEDLSVEGVWVADGEEEGDRASERGEEGGREGRDGYARGEVGEGCE